MNLHRPPKPPSGYPEASFRPSGSQPVGTQRLPSGYPEATPRLPRAARSTERPLLVAAGSEALILSVAVKRFKRPSREEEREQYE